MGRLVLSKDSSKGLYSLNVVIFSQKPGSETVPVKMFLDTGSTLTSITERVAGDMGVDIYSLPKENVAGYGSIRSTPYISNVDVAVLGDGGDLKIVTLKKIGINSDVIAKEKIRGKGLGKRKVEVSAEMVNLAGLDLMAELKGKVFLDVTNSNGYIEW